MAVSVFDPAMSVTVRCVVAYADTLPAAQTGLIIHLESFGHHDNKGRTKYADLTRLCTIIGQVFTTCSLRIYRKYVMGRTRKKRPML